MSKPIPTCDASFDTLGYQQSLFGQVLLAGPVLISAIGMSEEENLVIHGIANGKTHTEIARMLGRDVRYVKSRVQRIGGKIRACRISKGETFPNWICYAVGAMEFYATEVAWQKNNQSDLGR